MKTKWSQLTNEQIYTVETIAPDTYRIQESGFINCYLVCGSKQALLIDTGNGAGNIKQIVDKLTSLPLTVAITHRHADHIGGGGWFDRVLVPLGDMDKKYDSTSKRIGSLITAVTMKWYGNYPKQPHEPKMVPLDYDHVFELGERNIRMIHSPGHTMGSALYVDDANHLLFVGDNLGTTQLLALPGCESVAVWHSSAKQIGKMSAEGYTLFWGHYNGRVTPEQVEGQICLGEKILHDYENKKGPFTPQTVKDEKTGVSINFKKVGIYAGEDSRRSSGKTQTSASDVSPVPRRKPRPQTQAPALDASPDPGQKPRPQTEAPTLEADKNA